jgi:DNA-binding NarL/FixJ family response regulator
MNGGEKIRLLIVDEGDAIRRALRMRLASLDGVTVVNEVGTVAEALQLVAKDCPHVVLLGVGHAFDIVDSVRVIRRRCELVKVVVLAPYEFDGAEALSAGASAHLLKEADVDVLGAAIRKAVSE